MTGASNRGEQGEALGMTKGDIQSAKEFAKEKVGQWFPDLDNASRDD